MFRRFSINFALFSMGVDASLVALALFIATSSRRSLNPLPFVITIDEPIVMPWVLYVIFPLIWVLISMLFSVYDGRRNLSLIDEITSLTMASLLATVSLAGTLYLSFRMISRILFLVFVALAYIGMLSWRLIARLGLRLGYRPESQRRVLIIGAGRVGRQVLEQIEHNAMLGLTAVGFLDDDPEKRNQVRLLGNLGDVCRVVEKYAVTDVVIALPQRAYQAVNDLVVEVHTLPVKVWVIPDYFQLALHKAVVDDFAGLPMLDLRAPALNDYQRMVKRAFDLVITALALPPALLLMGVIAIAIRLEGPGPIILCQTRVGENGKLFGTYKFRTMVPNAEELRHLVEHYDEQGNLIHKTANDPRVTRVGRLLRRRSLDELPQLFNILLGEMSWVGPRPELPYLVERYQPWQRRRFAVPPGLTGWWQVNGRSDKPMHLHTEDDLYYVQNYSLMLDILILFKTIGTVLRGKGAF